LGDALDGGLQAGGIFDIKAPHGTVDLPQQAAQHFARTDLDENINAALDHFTNGIVPAHRQRDLPDERLTRFFAGADRFGIGIGNEREAQGTECRRA